MLFWRLASCCVLGVVFWVFERGDDLKSRTPKEASIWKLGAFVRYSGKERGLSAAAPEEKSRMYIIVLMKSNPVMKVSLPFLISMSSNQISKSHGVIVAFASARQNDPCLGTLHHQRSSSISSFNSNDGPKIAYGIRISSNRPAPNRSKSTIPFIR